MVMSITPNVINFITYPFAYWDEWLTEDEIKAIEKYCDDLTTDDAKIVTSGSDGVVDENIRKSETKMVTPDDHNRWMFDRFINIASLINNRFYGYDLNGFDYFQYTVYDGEGSTYNFHTDMVFGDQIPPNMPIPRKLSFSLLLSDPNDYEGGEFEFMADGGEPVVAEQKRGRILAFPSFVLHRVAPLKSGKRKSIVFWAVGPKFK